MVRKIKELAKSRGLSLSDLERVIGISNKGIYRWDIQDPGVHKVYRVAQELGVTVEDLIRD